jgi:exopolyphosphatase/pppGpp-phosphohydrolase
MKTTISPETEQKIQELYTSINHIPDKNVAISLLHIDSDYTVLAYGKNQTSPDTIWLLELGNEKTADTYFRDYPPTAGEIEEAIQTVEDEIMTLSKLLPDGSVLYTHDAGIREISQLAVNSELSVVTRSDIEQLFGRLTAIISGRPLSSDNLPATNSFVATLLILREVMFHLKFMSIKCL